jgi:uncharacterized protein YjdB
MIAIRWSTIALVLVAATRGAAQNVTEVQVAPPTISIKVGDHYGLLATAYDKVGNVLPAAHIQWVSNNVAVARVDNNGTVTGVSQGVAIVEARAGQKRGQAAVQVAAAPPPPPVAGGPTTVAAGATDPFAGQPPGTGAASVLRIDPPSVYLLPSEHTRVSPRALRDDGSPAAPIQVTWKSLREDIASVDGNGTVIALAPGQGTIQMTGPNGLTATAPVVVQQADFAIQEGATLTLAPGEVDTLHVVVPTQENRLVSPIALTWASTDQSVAQVSLTGVVRASGSGKASLSVSGFLQSKSIDLLVHRAVDVLAVRPGTKADVEVPVTSTVHFEAKALAADSTAVPEARLVWGVVDAAIATFDPSTGTLTGRKIGRTQLVLRGPGATPLHTSWNISVIAGTPKLGTSRIGITQGGRLAMKAGFTDDTGAVLGPASGLTWTSDAAGVASVSEDGTVSGVGPGHARVTAAAPGGKTATADIYVERELLLASSRSGNLRLFWLDRANLSDVRAAVTDTMMATEPAISPDGSRIAFVSTRDGNSEIYVMDADGANLTRVTNDPQPDGHPVFTADGTGLVFQSQRIGKPEIFSTGLDGNGVKALTADSLNQTPAVSPDGATIAYASSRNKNWDIWLMGRDGGNQRNFTKSPLQNETEPHFLRDGSLAYVVERKDENRTVRQVMKVNLVTGAATPLSGTDLYIAGFAVAPAGDMLALMVPIDPTNRKNPQYRMYLLQTGGGAPTVVPAGVTEQMLAPVFLP